MTPAARRVLRRLPAARPSRSSPRPSSASTPAPAAPARAATTTTGRRRPATPRRHRHRRRAPTYDPRLLRAAAAGTHDPTSRRRPRRRPAHRHGRAPAAPAARDGGTARAVPGRARADRRDPGRAERPRRPASCAGPATTRRWCAPAPFAVTSIDTVVEGTHFRLATHSPADVGWKALATALSDLAAMGAEPGEAYVSLVLPEGFDGALELVRRDGGARRGERDHDRRRRRGRRAGPGGDGRRDGLGRRRGASWWAATARGPGDLVGVTGELGGSEAGRRLLERGEREPRRAGGPPPAAAAAAGARAARWPRPGPRR